jgi:hypothetical protein
MKALRCFIISAAFLAVCTLTVSTMAAASETAENFAKWVPDFANADLNKRRDAQQNWQTFCRERGNDPAIQKEIVRVSVEQLAKDNPVDTAVWIIRQLGIAGDAAAVPALAKCLTNPEIRIRDEAARALANIPGKEAEEVLKRSNIILTAQLARDALTARAIKADVPKDNAVETAMPMAISSLRSSFNPEEYAQLSDMEKAQVLSNLTALASRAQVFTQQRRLSGAGVANVNTDNRSRAEMRADRTVSGAALNSYRQLALEAVQSSDETLCNAGILAVGALGGTAEIPFLLEQARTGANKDLAKLALSRMSGSRIDAFLLENLKLEQDAEKFTILADVLNRRFNPAIRPLLLERAQAAGTENRLQLLQLAEPASTKEDVGAYLTVWGLISDRGQKDRAEQIIARLVEGDARTVMQALGDWDTEEGLSLLGRIGDAGVLDQIRHSKNALHAFRNWTNAVVADDLMNIVRDDSVSEENRIAALRAFVRVISLPGTRPQDQIGIRISDVEKTNRLIEAYELATRNQEKVLIIQRLGQVRTVDSLRFIMKHIDTPELREDACQSVLELAHQTGLRRSAREEFNTALDKVLAVTNDPNKRNRANGYKAAQ